MSIIELPRRAKKMGEFVADKDYFADKDGNLVEKSKATTKVVSKGGVLTEEEAQKYGLGAEEAAPVEETTSEANAAPQASSSEPVKASGKAGKKSKK